MLIGRTIGPFEVEKELGAGAMGAVYRAKWKNGYVAIKVIAAGLANNERTLARFEREAALLKELRHPNIVRLIATGRFQSSPFYAMEYVEGETLESLLERRGRILWDEVIVLAKQICSALQHVHERGIIHRDLKPSNLMLTKQGIVKLTDFGIAKDLDRTNLTSANFTVGTAAYMSPEQCKGARDITHKSDLYALGIVLYELLVGHRPFHAENPMEMFLKHVKGKFDRVSELVLDVPQWLDTLICQLLEKKPDQRPRDAKLILELLEEGGSRPAAAPVAGPLPRAGKGNGELGNHTHNQAGGAATEYRESVKTQADLSKKQRRKKKREEFGNRILLGIGAALLVVMAFLVGIALLPKGGDQRLTNLKKYLDKADTHIDLGEFTEAEAQFYDAKRELDRLLDYDSGMRDSVQRRKKHILAAELYIKIAKFLRDRESDYDRMEKHKNFEDFQKNVAALLEDPKELPDSFDYVMKGRRRLVEIEAPELLRAGRDSVNRDTEPYKVKEALRKLDILARRYPESDESKKVADLREVLLVLLEALKKLEGDLSEAVGIEEFALRALREERDGKRPEALSKWRRLVKHVTTPDTELPKLEDDLAKDPNRAWILLAEHRSGEKPRRP